MSTIEVDVIVIRHSERLDEVDATAWKRAIDENKGRSCFKYDPLISPKNGVQYAREVAASLKALTASESRPVVVFASKLLRATQTASYIAHELGVAVHLSAGLAQIIPAVKNYRDGFEFADVRELQRHCCPEVQFLDCDNHTASSYSIPTANWRVATAEIIRKCSQEGCLPIIVAHRESVRKIAGEHLQTPYCCVGLFRLEGSSTALQADEKMPALSEQGGSEGRCGGASESTDADSKTADVKDSPRDTAGNSVKSAPPPPPSGSAKTASTSSSGAISAHPASSTRIDAAASHRGPIATAQATAGSRMGHMSAAGAAAAGGIVRCGTRDPTGHKAESAGPRPGSNRPRAGADASGLHGEAKQLSNRNGGGSSGAGKEGRDEIIEQLRLITVLDRNGFLLHEVCETSPVAQLGRNSYLRCSSKK